ncbi:MAG: zf-TFIIB domain-containing protein [Thermodesulfobacteriota bacterium]
MKCPVCVETDLLLSERQGVEIDYCPKCRGVWLDRGELDKIINAANQQQFAAPTAPPHAGQPWGHQPPPQQHQHADYHHDTHHKHHKHHKVKSLLDDLFDF